ncbi:MAG: hypothetical protein GY717_13555 [Rhodobacteraceae bacterium]|nr:hypothetical protein [Paracoccaceae bacterium]
MSLTGTNCVRALAMLPALALTLAVALPVDAKTYTRSCTATIAVSVAGGGNGVSHRFTGKGTVRGFFPNKARERARDNIDECLNAHWSSPHGLRPAACTSSNRIYDYPYRRLHQEVALEVCNRNPGRERIFINVAATYRGDTGCIRHPNIWNRTIRQNYLVQCATQRTHEPGIDRPGMDYRHFQTHSGWQACQRRCDTEAQCQAWTYTAPRTPDGPGTCWLKNGVPPQRPCSGCTSGVKVILH